MLRLYLIKGDFLSDSEAVMNRKYMEMIKLLNIYLNHFPKHEKYALSSQIRNTAYTLYDLITECQKKYYKKTTLTELDIIHEKLRMQIYLAYELGYFNFKDGVSVEKTKELEYNRLKSISILIDELGRMIGGWIKSIKSENKY